MGRVRVESAVRVLISAVVGGIGAAAGFTHTHNAAVASGQSGWLAWADAVVIECMVTVAGLQLLKDRSARRSVVFPVSVLVVAFVVQMGSQVALAPRTAAGWLFAAVPALGCLVVVKLALRNTKTSDNGGSELSSVDADSVRLDRPEATQQVEPLEETQVREVESSSLAAPAWPPR